MRPLIIPSEDHKECIEYVKNRLFNNGMMKIVSFGGEDTLVPKNKGIEYLLELILSTLDKKSTDVVYRELMTQIWGEKALNKECVMRQGVKECSDIAVPIIFSVVYNDCLKEWGEFSYE